jgi:ATP-dependent Clp protease ATP-binding subunit ClpC
LRNENDPTTKLLLNLNIEYDIVKEKFKLMITSENQNYLEISSSSSFPDEKDDENESGKENPFVPTTESRVNVKSKTPVLDNFGRDVTALAEKKQVRPCGR